MLLEYLRACTGCSGMNQIVSRGHSRPLTEIHYIVDDVSQNKDSKTLLVSSAHGN